MHRLVWHRLVWFAIALSLTGCGGGGKSGPTLTVVCSAPGGIQLNGATSIDVLGDVVNGRPTMTYPDPANAGQTGTIALEPRGRCTITPRVPS